MLISSKHSPSNHVQSQPSTLQELSSDVKAEVRALLQQHRVSQFKIRPVQRNYAFENTEVPHSLQWVLKVTYPATFPALPLGISGVHVYQ